MSLPSQQVRDDITVKLGDLVSAIETHPSWTPPTPPKGIYHVWDFVNRSRYIMTELDNILEGKPVKHPEQIPKNSSSSSGQEAARLSFIDVCSRSLTIDEMIQNPRMLIMLGLSQIDFGEKVREKSKAVRSAIEAASASAS